MAGLADALSAGHPAQRRRGDHRRGRCRASIPRARGASPGATARSRTARSAPRPSSWSCRSVSPSTSPTARARRCWSRQRRLGIPGITGYRAVFADGSVKGLTVLVWGAASGVGAFALQMAVRDGADVIGVVRSEDQRKAVLAMGAKAAFVADRRGSSRRSARVAPKGRQPRRRRRLRRAHRDQRRGGGHRGDDQRVLHLRRPPQIPYWTLGFADVALRLLGSDDFSPEVKLPRRAGALGGARRRQAHRADRQAASARRDRRRARSRGTGKPRTGARADRVTLKDRRNARRRSCRTRACLLRPRCTCRVRRRASRCRYVAARRRRSPAGWSSPRTR